VAWVDDYRKKLVTAEEAVSTIKSQQRVYVSGNAATPYTLLNALAERKDELEEVQT
jgi:4-hydroxybutyrate CoA-transferase